MIYKDLLYLTRVLTFLFLGACQWELVSSYSHSLAAHSVHVCSPIWNRKRTVVLKVKLYLSLSGIKLCALKKSISCALPMYPCKWPNYNSLCLYLLRCDPISSPLILYIESHRPIYRCVTSLYAFKNIHTSVHLHPLMAVSVCMLQHKWLSSPHS